MAYIFECTVVPNSGKSYCIEAKSGGIKCFLKSPPEKGKANRELIKLIARALSISQAYVTIVSGVVRRKKRICIDASITEQDIYKALNIPYQSRLFK